MEDAQRTIPWSDEPAERGYWLKGDAPLWNSVRWSAKLGRGFVCVGSEPRGVGNLTWFQIPPTTVNLFGYLLTVSWQLTFMFKIKCLIDYFLEQWCDVVLSLSQSISGLSHYWSLFLPFLVHCVYMCVCVCVHLRVRMCAPEGWESWRVEERPLRSENEAKLGCYRFPKLRSHKDFPVSKEGWVFLGMIHRSKQSPREFLVMVISLIKNLRISFYF